MDKKKVLFVCIRNSGRSQMAEAFFNLFSGSKASASSAGTRPAEAINPIIVQVMREVFLDISQYKPKLLTFEMMEQADKVITMGCGVEEACPAGAIEMEDWNIEDPEGKPIEKVRQIRNEIRQRVEDLISQNNNEIARLDVKGDER